MTIERLYLITETNPYKAFDANSVAAASRDLIEFVVRDCDMNCADDLADFLWTLADCLRDGVAKSDNFFEEQFWLLHTTDQEEAVLSVEYDDENYVTWTCHGVGRYDHVNSLSVRQDLCQNGLDVRKEAIRYLDSDQLVAVCEHILGRNRFKPAPPAAVPLKPVSRSVVV